MTTASEGIIGLLTYIEEVEKLKTKPAFVVPTDYFAAFQQDLKGLPEVRFNLQSAPGDEVWLKIPRIPEIAPPDPGESLRGWVTLSKSVEKKPELKTEAVVEDEQKQLIRQKLADRPDIQDVFDWYVDNQWAPWQSAERPRRKTISLYNKLFVLLQTIESEGAETPLELVWGLGFSTWKKEGQAHAVKHPMMVQACEVALNSRNFDLEVRPRDVDARLELDCYIEMDLPGVVPLSEFWKGMLTNSDPRVNPFESSTYEGTLRAAVGHLDSTGRYEVRTDDVTLPAVGDKLLITNTWVLFARKRNGDVFLDDIRRLKKTIEEASQLPPVICGFVEEGDSTVSSRPDVLFRGLSTSNGGGGAKELYFPMPYNDEQVSIIQKLENNDGVVVQGPPGTGKTHTIANVICHYLAMGKRVLVTSKGETALSVLQDKLPDRIRPLSVALLSQEREGMKQFEHAIQAIATGVEQIQPMRLEAAIVRLDAELNQLHAKISNVDQIIASHAASHMRSYKFQGRDIVPEELAKLVLQQAHEHEWFDDELPDLLDNAEVGLLDSDLLAVRQARMRVGSDLKDYLSASLPPNDDLPSWADLLILHRDIVRAKLIEADVESGDVLALLDAQYETFDLAQKLLEFVDQFLALQAKLAEDPNGSTLAKKLASLQSQDPVLLALLEACEAFKALETERKLLVSQAISLPTLAEKHPEFLGALTRLVEGKSGFALPFGRAEARQLVSQVTVLGTAPVGKEGWARVQELVQWRLNAHREAARWSSIAGEFGLDAPSSDLDATVRKIMEQVGLIGDARALVFDFQNKLHDRLVAVLGKSTADQVGNQRVSLDKVRLSLTAHLDRGRLGYAMQRVGGTLDKLRDRSGPLVEEIRGFLISDLGAPSGVEAELQARWLGLQRELSRLSALVPSFDEIQRVSHLVSSAGAPKWADRLRSQLASDEGDSAVPVRWREAWSWRLAFQLLEKIDVHQALRQLFKDRHSLTSSLAKTYQDLVAEKTWLGVFNNSPQNIRQALQAYLNLVQAMGSGTGKRAIRHRGHARKAMQKAYRAVPCWVLPHWRVSETLPAEIGLFDLVVIDEASQSDIWALPALLRGKKLLVVGDHKQVSPSIVGIKEQRIVDLEQRFLNNQFHGAHMTPDKSVYDLAKVVFAGNSVMLKEHFRCVPAIIEFSNREFYDGQIKPLRVPKANERLDPPLIDVYVKGGSRKVDVNAAEALAIVNEIEAILSNPAMNGRSIGVVTLLGIDQAKHINDLINERIKPGAILERQISVGPPPVFQGRERDIMMVSMVLAPGDQTAKDVAAQQQRINVALSRSRDRMYLFRSVGHNHFSESSLSGKVLRHFRQPFNQDARQVAVLRDLCESGFEEEMFDELTQRGFRVQPQVPCGSYRIDFVVEGSEGRRLAIECDGDRFHGPGQWSDDMARQRVLERAGWTFWRCFASSFSRRRQDVISDLLATLQGLGIEPLGAESLDNTVWVETREVDPFGLDDVVSHDQELAADAIEERL